MNRLVPFPAADRYHSPLRYPGGKAKLAPVVRALIQENNLSDGSYAEPYAGGAGLALGLLSEEYVRRIHINDLDRSVFSFWHTVLNDHEELCRRIERAPLTLNYWKRQRRVQSNKASADLVDLGFSTFYLNRTNRSGIISSGGLIGGVEQDGRWTMEARFNRAGLVARIRRIAGLQSRISVTNLDAVEFLKVMAKREDERLLVYLDPPYFVKGQRRLYANYYGPSDHAAVATFLSSYDPCWIVSYDYAPEILALYSKHRRHVYRLKYSAAQTPAGTEVMFFSDRLQIPAFIRDAGGKILALPRGAIR